MSNITEYRGYAPTLYVYKKFFSILPRKSKVSNKRIWFRFSYYIKCYSYYDDFFMLPKEFSFWILKNSNSSIREIK